MTHVTCRLTAKNRNQLRNPIRSAIEYGLSFTFYICTYSVVILFMLLNLCCRLAFSALTLLAGVRKSIRHVKMSDEVLVWLSEVQIVCMWSS